MGVKARCWYLIGVVMWGGCVLGSCAAPVSTLPDRRPAVYAAAGMAGLNNPNNPGGDEDNLSLALGAKLPVRVVSIRPEVHVGDHSTQWTPSVTYDFAIAGEGPGAIDGNVGLGYSYNSERENNVLGNTDSLFLRVGGEGYLVGSVLVGAALMVAPWAYDHGDTAVAGTVYFGVRF